MKLLRKIAPLVFIVACGAGSYLILSKGPCSSPMTYRIGAFDTKFGVSRETFLEDAAIAEKVWEDALQKEVPTFKGQLLAYDLKAHMPINLVYDTRQATVDTTKVIAATVDTTVATADTIKPQLTALKATYDQNESEYLAMKDSFDTKLARYNSEIAYWNSKGGARHDQYFALQQERSDLEVLQKQLNEKVIVVNDLARQVNSLVDRYNSLVHTANVGVRKINQIAGKEFEQGEYVSDSKGQRINVYEFDGKAKLIRLLAHEMGHALGMDHNSNPQSIMYYLNNGTSLEPSAEDIAALKATCRLK
jgi:hypothetical protein